MQKLDRDLRQVRTGTLWAILCCVIIGARNATRVPVGALICVLVIGALLIYLRIVGLIQKQRDLNAQVLARLEHWQAQWEPKAKPPDALE